MRIFIKSNYFKILILIKPSESGLCVKAFRTIYFEVLCVGDLTIVITLW